MQKHLLKCTKMKNIAEGYNWRIFQDKILGIWSYYILEDSSKAVQKQGVWYDVKITNYYFKTLKQIKSSMKLESVSNEIKHKQI
tara:strand:- start:853 stop:1104 length:252 start_codon:yes stop_codon:yes gene_type:complete